MKGLDSITDNHSCGFPSSFLYHEHIRFQSCSEPQYLKANENVRFYFELDFEPPSEADNLPILWREHPATAKKNSKGERLWV